MKKQQEQENQELVAFLDKTLEKLRKPKKALFKPIRSANQLEAYIDDIQDKVDNDPTYPFYVFDHAFDTYDLYNGLFEIRTWKNVNP